VAHEIGHALGLIHEHSRPDRDLYVYIRPGLKLDAYKLYRDSVAATYGQPYDVGSIMHYPINVCTKCSRLLVTAAKFYRHFALQEFS
jgi:hypothetical protein